MSVIRPSVPIRIAETRTTHWSGTDGERRARWWIHSPAAAMINATAVIGFIATCPGAPLVRTGMSHDHPTRARTATSATKTLHCRLKASSDLLLGLMSWEELRRVGAAAMPGRGAARAGARRFCRLHRSRHVLGHSAGAAHRRILGSGLRRDQHPRQVPEGGIRLAT